MDPQEIDVDLIAHLVDYITREKPVSVKLTTYIARSKNRELTAQSNTV